jgi:Type I phosphodiesterase / nucleotide pyrophosphatase
MGYARYIGRVGALAVTLGVGLAVASGPPVAYAEPSDSSSSSSDSSSTTKKSTTSKAAAGSDAAPSDESDGADSPASDPKTPSDPDPKPAAADPSTEETDVDDAAGDNAVDAEEGDGAAEETSDVEGETPAATADDDASPANGDATVRGSTNRHSLRVSVPSDVAGDDNSSDTTAVGQSTRSELQTPGKDAVAETSAEESATDASTDAVTTFGTTFSVRTTAVVDSAPATSQPRPTLVSVVSELVAAVLQPFIGQGSGTAILPSLLLGVLSAVRNEIERALFRRTAPVAAQQTVTRLDPTPNSLLADPTPNVLLIGVDGTNLSRILADPENENFFALMNQGTTAASSIVGHTTISNPSWSAILTGVWGERTGVINNVFTPWTYDEFPTVFNQLETFDSDIHTTSIADWDVISAISGAGSGPADEIVYVPQFGGDTSWDLTDDAVGDATVDAIANTDVSESSFVFSYFVGVDENGHMFGGASPEYAAAIRNVDDNLGEILTAIDDWEDAHPGEEWTIIMVTDHGHQPQKGFGHGFQTPDETATFVIARGPDFQDGFVNPDYEIVDTTPTVLDLFDVPPPPPGYFDGVSLLGLGGADEGPFGQAELHQALKDMIATNRSPDFVTNVALSLRTIFATIPYYVWTLNNDGTIPVPILGDVLYVATNVPAQIVAWLTGVTGASIFPLFPPGPPTWPGREEPIAPDTAVLACGGGELASAAAVCDAASVA